MGGYIMLLYSYSRDLGGIAYNQVADPPIAK